MSIATLPTNGVTRAIAVEARPVDMKRPPENANGLKALLQAQRGGIAQALPKHITPERLIKTLLVATNRNPAILRCTQGSILETINRAAELGLDLSGTLGEAYPVPYGDQLTLIIGYRGMEKLAWQTGEVEHIDAEVVYSNDVFDFEKGTEVHVRWKSCMTGDRGQPIGAYACLKMKSGGKLARFLPASDIKKIQSKSRSGNSPAWKDWPDEMWRKCALKRVLKDAPLSTEKYVKAMEIESDDTGLTDVVMAQVGTATGNATALQQRIAAGKAAKAEAIHPDGVDLDEVDPAIAEQQAALKAAESGESQLPDLENESNLEPEPPQDDSQVQINLADDEAFRDLVESIVAGNVDPGEFANGYPLLLVNTTDAKSPRHQKRVEARGKILTAIRTGKVNWKDGKIVT